MKLKDALICDVRKDGAWDGLNELLFKIKPLAKYEEVGEVPLESLEHLLEVFYEKYGVQLQYIMPTHQKLAEDSDEVKHYYSCSLKDRYTHKWIGSINGITIYECYVKVVLLAYGYIKSKQK